MRYLLTNKKLVSRAIFYVTALALLVVFIGDSPYYQETQARVSSDSKNLLRQFILFGFLVFASIPLLLRPVLLRVHACYVWPIYAAGGFVLISLMWSGFPSLSVIRILTFEVMLLSVFWITVLNPRVQRVKVWYFALFGITLIDALSFLVIPELTLDHEGRFKGIHSHKNELGVIMSLAVFFFIDHWVKYREKRALIALIMAMAMLVASVSKTALLLTFLLMPLFLVLLMNRRKAFVITVFVLIASLFSVSAFFMVNALGAWGGAVDDQWAKETFTQRTVIWEYARFKILEQPVLGYGFGGFWGTDPIRALSFYDANAFVRRFGQAHNGYLGVALELGLVGLSLWLTVLIAAVKLSVTQLASRSLDSPLMFVLLIYCLLHNIFEHSFFVAMSPLWFVLVFLLIHIFHTREISR